LNLVATNTRSPAQVVC